MIEGHKGNGMYIYKKKKKKDTRWRYNEMK